MFNFFTLKLILLTKVCFIIFYFHRETYINQMYWYKGDKKVLSYFWVFLLHACATCFELPSTICTMVRKGFLFLHLISSMHLKFLEPKLEPDSVLLITGIRIRADRIRNRNTGYDQKRIRWKTFKVHLSFSSRRMHFFGLKLDNCTTKAISVHSLL